MKCLICRDEAVYGDLCKDCWLGLKMFRRSTKLLGRAITYLNPKKGKLLTRHERREKRKRNAELTELILSQKRDANDREIRFERAIGEAQPVKVVRNGMLFKKVQSAKLGKVGASKRINNGAPF